MRYVGLFREQEPDLPAILKHKRLLILGEPGAGKSTTGLAIIQHLISEAAPKQLPIEVSLKSYAGILRDLLEQSAPTAVLDAGSVTRAYILDGIDEIPEPHRKQLVIDIDQLFRTDPSAQIVLTCRQAYHAHHPDAFPDALRVYHLLDFDNDDVKAFAKYRGLDASTFLEAVRDAGCEEEIGNPFVLGVMLERYQTQGKLSPLRSDNVGYVIDRLIQSRTVINAVRQRRALKMLAVACETAARNELT